LPVWPPGRPGEKWVGHWAPSMTTGGLQPGTSSTCSPASACPGAARRTPFWLSPSCPPENWDAVLRHRRALQQLPAPPAVRRERTGPRRGGGGGGRRGGGGGEGEATDFLFAGKRVPTTVPPLPVEPFVRAASSGEAFPTAGGIRVYTAVKGTIVLYTAASAHLQAAVDGAGTLLRSRFVKRVPRFTPAGELIAFGVGVDDVNTLFVARAEVVVSELDRRLEQLRAVEAHLRDTYEKKTMDAAASMSSARPYVKDVPLVDERASDPLWAYLAAHVTTKDLPPVGDLDCFTTFPKPLPRSPFLLRAVEHARGFMVGQLFQLLRPFHSLQEAPPTRSVKATGGPSDKVCKGHWRPLRQGL
jgi:hypothetical protein